MDIENLIDATDRLFGDECGKRCSECIGCCVKDMFNEIKEVLEKQIPKKANGYSCPICYHYFEDGEDRNYCPHCGQKIDWSIEF